MGGITMAELRHGLRRFVAPTVAIVLGVAFLTATLVLNSTMQATLERAAGAEVAGHQAVVSGSSLGPNDLTRARSVPGVSGVDIEHEAAVTTRGSGTEQTMVGRTLARSRIEPSEGRMSARTGEVVLNRAAAAALGASAGDPVTVGGSPGRAERRTVAGVVRTTGFDSTPIVLGTSAEVSRWSGSTAYSALLVRSSQSPDATVQALSDALGADITVRTADQEVEHRTTELVTGIQYITMFFAMFALIALFVAGMVITNTFQILLAQRARQLALLRCVGASRRQVARGVLGESLTLGLFASALGVAGGIGVVAVLVGASDRLELTALPLEQLGVSPLAVVVPLTLGVVATVLAALRPARRASRVAPLAALRPEPTAGPTRASRVRIAVGSAVAAIGFAGVLLDALGGSAPIAVLSGLLSFLGVVLTTPVVVPALARRLGRVAGRLAGITGELATDNTVRNPRRTAATNTALLVGITLMASMLVGASTSKASIDRAVNEQFALDVAVAAEQGSVPEAVERDVVTTEGVHSSAVLRTTRAEVEGPRLAHEQTIIGVPDAARSVLRDPAMLDGLAPGRILIDKATASDFGLDQGDRLQINDTSLTVWHTEQEAGGLLVTARDLARIDPSAGTGSIWLRLTEDADPAEVTGQLSQVASADGLEVSGAAGARAELDTLVRLMLLIVTTLLGVAVLIAMVGVANTLALSVLERRRETALLRALGLTARQVRRTLAVEALLVALVAALMGTTLGVVYGWAGTRALLGKYAEGIAPQAPVGLLVVLVLAAAACGLLASWAPARRAARTSPVAALAAD